LPTSANFNGVEYSVYQISSEAFYQCSDLTTLTIPASIYAIKNNAFGMCYSLTKLIIEDSETPLTMGYRSGSGSFHELFNGSPINSIYLGRNLNYTANPNSGYYGPFSHLPIKDIYISDYVTVLPTYIFSYCNHCIESIRFSPNLVEIGAGAFNQSLNMSKIEIPNLVTIIKSNAFYGNSSIREIILGGRLTKLETYAFSQCENISVVYCHTVTPPPASGAANIDYIANARLRVPAESVEAYKSDTWWKYFGEILPLEDSMYPPTSPLKFTIHFPESGSIAQAVKEGQQLSLYIQPKEGWSIHSVSHNGNDVTNYIGADGLYITDPIHEDTDLYVVFKSDSSASVSITSDDKNKVLINNNTIEIVGKYSNAILYSIDGSVIDNHVLPTHEVEASGIFILQVDGNTYKFAIGR